MGQPLSKGGKPASHGGVPLNDSTGCGCCAPTCTCLSTSLCDDCPDVTPAGYAVTITGATVCTGCIACVALGISFQFDTSIDINGTYKLAQTDSVCVWGGIAIGTGKLYSSIDCTGAYTPVTFTVGLTRSGGVFTFGITACGGGFCVDLFFGAAPATNCCVNVTINNTVTACGCYPSTGSPTGIAATTGGTANITPDNTPCSCGNCPTGTTPRTILATFANITLCAGCFDVSAGGSPAYGHWVAGATLNQTVCLHQTTDTDVCCYAGTITAEYDVYSDNACTIPIAVPAILTWNVRVCRQDATTWYAAIEVTEYFAFEGTGAAANCTDPFTITSITVHGCGPPNWDIISSATTGTVSCTPNGC
jgi:hypothetical protein